MTSIQATELADLVLSPVAGLQFTRNGYGGRSRYVVSDLRRGRHLSLRPDAYRLLGAFDGRRTVAEIYAERNASDISVFPAADTAARVIAALHGAGIVTADALPPRVAAAQGAPLEAKLVSWRRELIELGPWLAALDRLLGGLFTRTGLVLWSGLLIAAAWSLAGHPFAVSSADTWLARIDTDLALGLYCVFLLLKLLHELGHAVAFRRFAAAEGVEVNSVRAGLALMFLVPFPFTNVTGAWQLASRRYRMIVGAAGMYVESWAALVAVIVWCWSSDPSIKAAAGQVAAVSSITTIIFNLNPLGRMDGYYIFADLVDRPNLAQQASRAALGVFGKATGAVSNERAGSTELPLLVYWLGAWLFRLTIYAALFWTAVRSGAVEAVAVLLIAGSLLVGRPLYASLRWILATAPDRPRTRRRLLMMAAGLMAALMIPLPSSMIIEGIVERHGMTLAFPPRPARLSSAEPATFSTEEVGLDRAELEARHQLVFAQWRDAVDGGQEDARALGAQAGLLAEQSDKASRDYAAMRLPISSGGSQPTDLEDHLGSTVASGGGRPLAVRLPSKSFVVRAVAPELSRKAITGAAEWQIRPFGSLQTFRGAMQFIAPSAGDHLPSAALGKSAGGQISVAAQDRSGRTAAGQIVELVVSPQGRFPILRQGQRVELRFDERPASSLVRLYRTLSLALGAAAGD